MVPFPLAFDSARSVLAVKGHASVAGIHQTLKEARSLYAEAVKLQEVVLASHRDLKGSVALAETWHKSAESLLAPVETSRVRLKYLGRGFLALVFMIGTLRVAPTFVLKYNIRTRSLADPGAIKDVTGRRE